MRWISLWAATCLLMCGQCLAASAVEIEEWPVPWENSRPRDPAVAPDGRIWFVGQTDNYLAVFDPTNQQFKRFELPEGTRPHSVSIDAQGRAWVAGNGNGSILRYNTEGELQQRYDVPVQDGLARPDPHTFAFDGHGGLWFSMQGSNAIGHLQSGDGRIRVVLVPTAQSRPYGIVSDAKGDAWVVLFGVGKLAHVQRANMQLQEIDLPRPLSRPRRLSLDGQGRIWYVDYAQDYLGRYDPASGETREWPLPMKPAAPYAMAIDGAGRLWFFATAPQPNQLLGFDPQRDVFLEPVAVASGGGSVRHMQWDAARNSLWFGTDRNTLGQARLTPTAN